MATLSDRLPENAPGPWYITSECIDCDMCRETAPTLFKRHDDIGFSIIFHQPESEVEQREAMDAMEGCPASAIGNDAA